MLGGLINGLIVAWILVQFDIDNKVISILQPFVHAELNTDHFYFILGFIGLLQGCLLEIFM